MTTQEFIKHWELKASILDQIIKNIAARKWQYHLGETK